MHLKDLEENVDLDPSWFTPESKRIRAVFYSEIWFSWAEPERGVRIALPAPRGGGCSYRTLRLTQTGRKKRGALTAEGAAPDPPVLGQQRN